MSTIRTKDRDALLHSLRAGRVQRVSQQRIQVGRVVDLDVLLKDVELRGDGDAAFRVVIRVYCAGKSWYLILVLAI